jgi:hypothetical protein
MENAAYLKQASAIDGGKMKCASGRPGLSGAI